MMVLPCSIILAQDEDEKDSTATNQTINLDLIPTIAISDDDGDNNNSDQNVSSMLSSSRDPFINASSFVFGQVGYRYRGYGNDQVTTLMNGAIMNDPETGGVFWGVWGGLNDVIRSRETSVSLSNSTIAFGGLGGSVNIDSRAGSLRKGLNLTYSITNRNYTHRLMATYATGMLKGGWAVAASFSRRWAKEAYTPGTFFDGYSYYFSVEKKFGSKHSLSLTSFGTPTRNGRAGMAIQEVYNLAGTHYYNPFWGYQNGEKRNSSVSRRFEPTFILNYDFKPSNKTSWSTAVLYQFGESSLSGFDWYNAASPAPDYYRNLPSFQTDSYLKSVLESMYQSDPDLLQINWDRMYEVNKNAYDSVENANGTAGNTVRGNRSHYVLGERVEYTQKVSANSYFNHSFNDHVMLSGGVTYMFDNTHFYKRLADLLGGDFFVDVNQFAITSNPTDPNAPIINLDIPYKIVKVGDQYGYNYKTTYHKASGWLQSVFKFNHIDFFVAAELSNSAFWRTGLIRSGLFPSNSKGQSEKLNFINYAFKAGITGKINGRNYVFLNGMYKTEAPQMNNVFVSIRTRNELAPRYSSEEIYGGEIGYYFVAPKYKVKATFFYTEFKNGMNTINYFNDQYNSFVNYTMNGINKRHFGAEIGADLQVYKGLSASAALNIARYTYTSRPHVFISQDNATKVLAEDETVYMKNFYVGRTPQLASTFGLRYRGKQFYTVGVNFNYYDWMYVEVNPARRTETAVDLVPYQSEQWYKIINQEKLKGQFTMDLNGSYSLMLNKHIKAMNKTKYKYFININATITNLTNNRNFVSSAYEQARFDFDNANPDKFPTKYRYLNGIGFYIGLNFRLQ